MNKILVVLCLSLNFFGCSSMNLKPTVGVSVDVDLSF
jgi:hypothetical protein